MQSGTTRVPEKQMLKPLSQLLLTGLGRQHALHLSQARRWHALASMFKLYKQIQPRMVPAGDDFSSCVHLQGGRWGTMYTLGHYAVCIHERLGGGGAHTYLVPFCPSMLRKGWVTACAACNSAQLQHTHRLTQVWLRYAAKTAKQARPNRDTSGSLHSPPTEGLTHRGGEQAHRRGCPPLLPVWRRVGELVGHLTDGHMHCRGAAHSTAGSQHGAWQDAAQKLRVLAPLMPCGLGARRWIRAPRTATLCPDTTVLR